MRYCPAKVDVSLGEFASMDAGDRASIQRLSVEVCRCPQASKYTVFWKAPPENGGRDYRAVIYRRREKGTGRLGQEFDPESGIRGDSYAVSDEMIHAISQSGGTFEDFAKHQQQPR